MALGVGTQASAPLTPSGKVSLFALIAGGLFGIDPNGKITRLDATTTNDNAAAGTVGEEIKATVAVGSAVALTTNTAANVTSISLTAGDWEVEGVVDFNPAATTSITQLTEGANNVTATLGGQDTFAQDSFAAQVPGANVIAKPIPKQRFSLASTTTVFLVAKAQFTVSTLGAFGTIRARRVR